MGVCFFLQSKFSTSLLASLAGDKISRGEIYVANLKAPLRMVQIWKSF
jgi:hypothetical protein